MTEKLDKDEIRMTIPADSRFVALTRVTASSLAAELDFTIDEIDEIRIAADELSSLVIEWAEDNGHDSIELRYRMTADSLEIGAAAGALDGTGPSETQDLDEITRQILNGVVDSYEIGVGSGWVIKRRSAL